MRNDKSWLVAVAAVFIGVLMGFSVSEDRRSKNGTWMGGEAEKVEKAEIGDLFELRDDGMIHAKHPVVIDYLFVRQRFDVPEPETKNTTSNGEAFHIYWNDYGDKVIEFKE